jgi:hypothetical protein
MTFCVETLYIDQFHCQQFGTQTMYGLREKDFHIHVGKSAAVAIIRDGKYMGWK